MIANNLSNAFFKENKKPSERHRVPENMTDAEIKNKLCKQYQCRKCDVLDKCLYGQQCIVRNLQ